MTETIADLSARVDFRATGDPALSDAAASTELSLLGYGELYSLYEGEGVTDASGGYSVRRSYLRPGKASSRSGESKPSTNPGSVPCSSL